jgi:membrane-associated protease RseP (regulator of RpoE activity)
MKRVWQLGVLGAAWAAGMASPGRSAPAQGNALAGVSGLPGAPFFSTRASQGYLGVNVQDVDQDRAQQLKMKQPRGAEIVTMDHDAPACKAGLRLHDVILEMNGQSVEGVEQLRRMLRETPAGRTVSFLLLRDGGNLTISVELGDRAAIEQQAWANRFVVPAPAAEGPPAMGFAGDADTAGHGGGWSLLGGDRLNAGASLDPLGEQLADYFGVKSGVLVRSVEKGSPAAAAGLRAGDVILKVNQEAIVTRDDWTRNLRANLGRAVQITLLRDKKQQTVTMVAESRHHKGALEMPEDLRPEGKALEGALAGAPSGPAGPGPASRVAGARCAAAGIDPEALERRPEALRHQRMERVPEPRFCGGRS